MTQLNTSARSGAGSQEHSADFDQWARAVRQQMLEALKRRETADERR